MTQAFISIRRFGRAILRTVVGGGLFAVAVGMPTAAQAQGAIFRLAADPLYFGPGEEASTDVDALGDGSQIYSKSIFVPPGKNTLFLTMSTTGDQHDGAAQCFTARLDGVFFNPGGQGAARCADSGSTPVPGWVTLQKTPAATGGADNCNEGGGGAGDCHDNSIHYEWCTAITPGVHEVEVRMATDSNGKTVFIEQAFFYVDAAQLVNSPCEPLLPVPPPPLP
jgi:hypothetical protein